MENEKRKVGDYTVLCAVNVGSREIILAENEQDSSGERFLCCYGERNDIFEKFTECAVGDDYIDAILISSVVIMEREFQSQAEISSKSRVDGYDDFIFVNRYGDVQNQGNLNKALRRMMRDCNDEILEKYGADSDPVLLPQFSCHILRHTFATRLCESGANLKFIQSILGHADVSTTMNIYVDVTDALKKKEITAFDDYMTTKLET